MQFRTRSLEILRLAAIGAAALAATVAPSARAQSFVPRAQLGATATENAAPRYRPVVGEKAVYDVEVKGHGVGEGSLAIVARETIDGHPVMHASLKLDASLFRLGASERLDSWFDPDRLFTRHFEQHQRELRSTRQKNYLISPESKLFQETYSSGVDTMSTDEPLDDISMLYFARTLPLRVGDVDTIPRYFKRGHDVIVRVLRRETITVPAGKFQTIVVQPVITNAGGLFGQGGKAEVYVSDDAARTVVMIRASVPVLGAISLTLRELMTP